VSISTAQRSTCTATFAEFDFRYSNRSRLGIEDMERMDMALKGAKGKRLKYRAASGP